MNEEGRENKIELAHMAATTDVSEESGQSVNEELVTVNQELEIKIEELEARVIERTGELAKSNSNLQAEIGERTAAEKRVEELFRRLVSAQETERCRIARELHDEMGQQMTAMMLGLKTLKENLHLSVSGKSQTSNAALNAESQIERLQIIAEAVDREVDRLTMELRPTALDDLGLLIALQQHAETWSEETGISVDFYKSKLGDERLSPETETTLYRIVQEALTNIVKHAAARRVSIILERCNNYISLIVEDDGRGFDSDGFEAARGIGNLGLLGMRERIKQAGGEFRIESATGSGTSLPRIVDNVQP